MGGREKKVFLNMYVLYNDAGYWLWEIEEISAVLLDNRLLFFCPYTETRGIPRPHPLMLAWWNLEIFVGLGDIFFWKIILSRPSSSLNRLKPPKPGLAASERGVCAKNEGHERLMMRICIASTPNRFQKHTALHGMIFVILPEANYMM